MMTARLVELRRVLKPTGSLYLHCDPTVSHYLKVILDMIFETGNFRNEIVWKRMTPSGFKGKTSIGKGHDIILCFSKSNDFLYNPIYLPYTEQYIKERFSKIDERGRRFKEEKIGTATSQATIDKLKAEGRIYYTSTGKLRIKHYLDEVQGIPLDDVWTDIHPVNSIATERIGYPTQKPLALLERIIQASSNPGDVVLDPFCGCGTAVHAAQKLGRTWIGIDITRLATTLIKSRLYDAFQLEAKKDYDLIGEPTTLTEAKHLASQDRYQFQWWALGLIPARPQGGQGDSKTGKKGKDRGIDGIMTFQDDPKGLHKRIIIQVKSGKVKSEHIRSLIGTVDSEKAVMGVFITLEPPSRDMELAALSVPKWHSDTFNRDYPRIQILTIEELLNGAKVQFPGTDTTLSKAQREQEKQGEQGALL